MKDLVMNDIDRHINNVIEQRVYPIIPARKSSITSNNVIYEHNIHPSTQHNLKSTVFKQPKTFVPSNFIPINSEIQQIQPKIFVPGNSGKQPKIFVPANAEIQLNTVGFQKNIVSDLKKRFSSKVNNISDESKKEIDISSVEIKNKPSTKDSIYDEFTKDTIHQESAKDDSAKDDSAKDDSAKDDSAKEDSIQQVSTDVEVIIRNS
jgi:hypothetical protein